MRPCVIPLDLRLKFDTFLCLKYWIKPQSDKIFVSGIRILSLVIHPWLSHRHPRVGKTWLPCHDHIMIMAKHGHDHAMMTAWQPCFLAWSSWFTTWSWNDYHVFHNSYHDHGMNIMLSMFFFLKIKWITCQCFLSDRCYHIPLHSTLDCL